MAPRGMRRIQKEVWIPTDKRLEGRGLAVRFSDGDFDVVDSLVQAEELKGKGLQHLRHLAGTTPEHLEGAQLDEVLEIDRALEAAHTPKPRSIP